LEFLRYVTAVFRYVPRPVCEKRFFCSLCLSAWNFSVLCTPMLFSPLVAVVTEVSSGYCGVVTLAVWLLRLQRLTMSFCSHDFTKAAEVFRRYLRLFLSVTRLNKARKKNKSVVQAIVTSESWSLNTRK